jgi:hypothetical protein
MARKPGLTGGEDRWLMYTVAFFVVATLAAVGVVGVALLIGCTWPSP